MTFIGLDSLDLIGNIITDIKSSVTYGEVILTYEFENFSQFCVTCVGYSKNKNVTDPPKEFLLWHWKLGIRMYHIKEFMKDQTMEKKNGNKVALPPII